MALLDFALLYYTLSWLYLTLLHSIMALLDFALLYCILRWLHLTLLQSTLALLDSTTIDPGSTWLYYNRPWLYLAVLDSTELSETTAKWCITVLSSFVLLVNLAQWVTDCIFSGQCCSCIQAVWTWFGKEALVQGVANVFSCILPYWKSYEMSRNVTFLYNACL